MSGKEMEDGTFEPLGRGWCIAGGAGQMFARARRLMEREDMTRVDLGWIYGERLGVPTPRNFSVPTSRLQHLYL